MKTKIISLAGTLVLSLLTSATFAGKEDPASKYEPTAQQVTQSSGDPTLLEEPTSGVLKALRNCPEGTDDFLKNINPFISGGSSGSGSFTGTIDVAGTGVTLFVEWFDDNSFLYDFPDGKAVMETIGVENNSDKLVYRYNSPVFSDSGLNVINGGEAPKANSLDLCVSLVDIEGPVITFISPPDQDPPAKVSSSVTVLVSVSDPSGVDLSSVTIRVEDENGQSVVTDTTMSCELVEDGVYECTYLWTTAGLPGGFYTLTASAGDLASTGVNTATKEVIVDFGLTLADCFGVLDDTDLDGTEPEGCNPTGKENIQAPFGASDPDSKSIFGEVIQAKSGLEGTCDSCGGASAVKSCGPDALPDPRMAYDGVNNRWYPAKYEELRVFAEVGVPPANLAASLPEGVTVEDAWVIGPLHYGYEGCFGGTWTYKDWLNIEAYPTWPDGGLFFIKTWFPEDTWETVDRPVAKCYGDDVFLETLNLQESAEFLYQSTDKNEMIEGIAAAYTEACGSGRYLTKGKSFAGWNFIETTPDIDATAEAVLQWKCDLIDEKFTSLQTALAIAKGDLDRGKVSTAERYIKQAQSQAENCPQVQSLDRAYGDLQSAFDAWQRLVFIVTEPNLAGDVLGRIKNLQYRIDNARAEILRLDPQP